MSRAPSILLCMLALALASGCSRDETQVSVPAVPVSILLVTLDTTRADRIGAYGYRKADTPTLDRLAREGVLFENAIAPTPITLPSHASILTGVIPPEHGVRDNTLFRLLPEAQLVSEPLRRGGWRTGAFVGAFVLNRSYGLDQGFETYRTPQYDPSQPQRAYTERGADDVVSDAISWLATLGPDEHFFVWLHFYDPHMPWQSPERIQRRVADAYDAEITFCDEQLARLLAWLSDQERDRNLLIAVTADHGEALGEHREETHGLLLYQATLHVPLILHGPVLAAARGTRVRRTVGTVDLAPTLLALAGLSESELPRARGRSLIRDGRLAPPDEDRAYYIETLMPYYTYRWSGLRGVVWKNYKLIDSHAPEIYDVFEDRSEAESLSAEEPGRVAELRERLERTLERGSFGWGEERTLAGDETRMLEALGYMEGSPGEDPFAPNLPDVRDRIGATARFSRASDLLRSGLMWVPADPEKRGEVEPKRRERGLALLRQARDLLAQIHAEEPNNPDIFVRLGRSEALLENYEAALPHLERGVAYRPRSAPLRYHLALSYWALGRDVEARSAIRAALAIEHHENPDYKVWLENHLVRN